MSQENVDIVRAALDAYYRGEPDWDVLARDVVWNAVEEEPQHGPDGVRAYMERWESPWAELETTAEEFIDAGDRVVVKTRFRGRGRESGAVVEACLYEVFTLRDGKVVRMDEFSERADALECAGLPA